jgi:release factor glutamine methyltransferase
MNNQITIKELIDKSTNFLKKRHIQNPKSDVEILLAEILKSDRLDLYLNLDKKVEAEKVNQMREAIKLKGKKMPVSYILKSHQFMHLKLKINQNVFIPRPETEILVESVMKILSNNITHKFYILDIGTGCGNIPIAIATKSSLVRILAIDNSYQAIKLAEQNANLYRVSKKIDFFQFDILNDDYQKLKARTKRLDIVVSNPPYIPKKALASLPDEIKLYEPMDAISGGEDGLSFIKKIILIANGLLKRNGFLLMEIGDNQADDVKRIANKFFDIRFQKDLNGIDRIFIGTKKQR